MYGMKIVLKKRNKDKLSKIRQYLKPKNTIQYYTEKNSIWVWYTKEVEFNSASFIAFNNNSYFLSA